MVRLDPLSAHGESSNFGNRTIVYSRGDQAFIHEDDRTEQVSVQFKSHYEPKIVIPECERRICLIGDHAFLDGAEELLPKLGPIF